jgi:hypothetical protein
MALLEQRIGGDELAKKKENNSVPQVTQQQYCAVIACLTEPFDAFRERKGQPELGSDQMVRPPPVEQRNENIGSIDLLGERARLGERFADLR